MKNVAYAGKNALVACVLKEPVKGGKSSLQLRLDENFNGRVSRREGTISVTCGSRQCVEALIDALQRCLDQRALDSARFEQERKR